MAKPIADLVGTEHDHRHCMDQAMELAEALCARRGARLTALRKRVLALVWRSHNPVGAYELLDSLKNEDKRSAAPPTVYRALDFLLEHGFIHKLESINAYIGCHQPRQPHSVPFLICKSCGRAVEMEDERATRLLTEQAQALGFRPLAQTLEVHGRCARCVESE